MLSVHGVAKLQQSLELVVPGEGDDLQHGAELTEDLQRERLVEERWRWRGGDAGGAGGRWGGGGTQHLLQDLQGHRVEQVLHNDPEDGALAVDHATAVAPRRHGPRMHCCCVDGL